jgi:hypothetical protein
VPMHELTHPPEDELFQAVHEPARVRADLRAHLDACPACQQRMQQLLADDVFVGGLLTALDHPVPAHSAHDVIAAHPSRLRRRALLAAEITIFAVAAAAAMTIPASPLHRWIVRQALPVASQPAVFLPEAAPSQSASIAPTGIALPAPASLRVEFRQSQHTGTLEVHLVDGGQVTVRSRGGDVGYTVNEGRVLVDNRVPANEYIVVIPASLGRVRIVVGTRVLFRKDGDRSGPVQPFEGARYRIALTDTTPSQP